jgi:hypothetical protein
VSAFGHPGEDACIRFTVNGNVRQDGCLNEMIWPIADIISHLSRLVTLVPGDLIFTGRRVGWMRCSRGTGCMGRWRGWMNSIWRLWSVKG